MVRRTTWERKGGTENLEDVWSPRTTSEGNRPCLRSEAVNKFESKPETIIALSR